MIEIVKKRRVSKKTKKSWRKNVDVKDVDRFLENERLEERLGGPFSEKTDSQLFSVDKCRDETLLSKSERRARLKLKEPRCFALLKPHTAVPDPITVRNRVKTPEERKNPITRRVEEERKKNGFLKKKEKDALRDRALTEDKKAKRRKRGEFKEDIWETDLNTAPELNNPWYTSDTVRHVLSNTERKRKRVPTTLAKKPSVVPAVQIPHPGTSYNPSFSDHQDLLREVAEKQLKFEKEEAHLNRVTHKMFKKVSAEEKNKNTMKEMSEGLQLESGDRTQEHEDEDNDPTVRSVNPPVKNAKKTLQKRRKQKEQRQLELQRRQQKVEKKKVSDLYKLKLLHKQMARKEKKEIILREMRQKNKERKAIEPKVLSKVKFEASEPDFKLGGELTGNLRNAEPVGNLLKDRYKSLQQRSIVAPGTLVLKRTRPSVKTYIKADHKIDWKANSTKK